MTLPVSFRWPSEFVAAVDSARGDVPRTVWIRRTVEAALTEPARPGVAPRRSASPSASGEATGCPECGGALSGVLDRPGVNACVDCGWTG